MVKTPIFPTYTNTANLMKILDGGSVQQFKDMYNAVWDLRGTPQDTVDWSNPDDWIANKLQGENRLLAQKIWHGTKKIINPRWIRGERFLITGYKLLEEINGKYQIIVNGKDFLNGLDNTARRRLIK
jgi:restriction system protein